MQDQPIDKVPSILSKVTLLRGDKVLWAIIPILFTLSALVVYSSVAKMGYAQMGTHTTAIFTRHLAIMAVAAVVLFSAYAFGARLLYKLAPYAYAICWLLTLGVYIFGAQGADASRWYNIMGISLQPSELLKFATLLLLARNLDLAQQNIDKQQLIPSLNPRNWRKGKRAKQIEILRNGVWRILCPIALSAAVILKAHNSSALLVFVVGITMVIIARAKWLEVGKVALIALFFVVLYIGLGSGRSSTISTRWNNFVEYWTDSQQSGKTTDADYAMVAIYDGGVLGVGAGQSFMRAKIVHPESDYIFAFFVEEYGIIIGMLLIMMYAWIFARALHIFRNARWLFGGLLVVGLALMITAQAILHFAVSTNLFMETGQNLPLISHGGTSMVCTAAALGVILSISRQVENDSLTPPEGIAAMTPTEE